VVSPTIIMATGHDIREQWKVVSGGRYTFHVHQDALRNRLAGMDGYSALGILNLGLLPGDLGESLCGPWG
jgi:hypothetical protein